jgi:hypothetical protein
MHDMGIKEFLEWVVEHYAEMSASQYEEFLDHGGDGFYKSFEDEFGDDVPATRAERMKHFVGGFLDMVKRARRLQ